MNGVLTVLLTAQIVAIVFILLLGYRGLMRLALSLMQLADYMETLHNSPHQRLLAGDNMPATLIVPDCDADPDIIGTVKGLLSLDYPEFEVVAVCHAARGGAMQKLARAFSLIEVHQPIKQSVPMAPVRRIFRSPTHRNLIVVDKKDAGRADSLNTGVNVSHYPLVVTLGNGRRLLQRALVTVASPFTKSFEVEAVGGLPRIHQGAEGLAAAMQQAEYMVEFPAGLTVPGQKKLPMVAGAFGGFRKKNLIEGGGFIQAAAEMDMVLRLYRGSKPGTACKKVHLLAEPVYDVRPAKGLKDLFRQRRLWQKEIISSLWRNRGMMLNPRYGRTGLWDIPMHWLFEVLAPILELFACIAVPVSFALGLLGPDLFKAFLAVEVLLGVVVSLAAVISQLIVESDNPSLNQTVKLVFGAVLGNIGYRQLMLVFRVAAMAMPYPQK